MHQFLIILFSILFFLPQANVQSAVINSINHPLDSNEDYVQILKRLQHGYSDLFNGKRGYDFSKDLKAAYDLLQKGVNPNTATVEGFDLLIASVLAGDAQVVKSLLRSERSKPNDVCDVCYSALLIAWVMGRKSTMAFMPVALRQQNYDYVTKLLFEAGSRLNNMDQAYLISLSSLEFDDDNRLVDAQIDKIDLHDLLSRYLLLWPMAATWPVDKKYIGFRA